MADTRDVGQCDSPSAGKGAGAHPWPLLHGTGTLTYPAPAARCRANTVTLQCGSCCPTWLSYILLVTFQGDQHSGFLQLPAAEAVPLEASEDGCLGVLRNLQGSPTGACRAQAWVPEQGEKYGSMKVFPAASPRLAARTVLQLKATHESASRSAARSCPVCAWALIGCPTELCIDPASCLGQGRAQ